MILEITRRFALGPIIGKLVPITEPGIALLPAGICGSFHKTHFLTLASFGKGDFNADSDPLFHVGGRVQNNQFWKELLIKDGIAGNQAGSLKLGMGANKKIGKDTSPMAALFAVLTPDPAGQKAGMIAEIDHVNFVILEEKIAIAFVWKMTAKFGVDQFADHKRTGACARLDEANGRINEFFVG